MAGQGREKRGGEKRRERSRQQYIDCGFPMMPNPTCSKERRSERPMCGCQSAVCVCCSLLIPSTCSCSGVYGVGDSCDRPVPRQWHFPACIRISRSPCLPFTPLAIPFLLHFLQLLFTLETTHLCVLENNDNVFRCLLYSCQCDFIPTKTLDCSISNCG